MTFTTKLAAGVMLAAATSTALTGCGKKGTTTNPSTSAKSTMSSSAHATVTAVIGGKTKHITAGQQCQQAHAADYTKYGFTCAPKTSGSSTYVLTAK